MTDTTAPLIKVIDLSRRFGDLQAIEGLSFSLQRGEVLGFLGPNGAGKSTTMNLLAGSLLADSGSIEICGAQLGRQTLEAKRRLGYLPEQPPLYADMSVDDYLRFCGRLYGLKGGKLNQSLSDTKSRCGLEMAGKRLLRHLSKGYQQRVGLAQALIHNPEVLVLDEPTSGLDPLQLIEIRKLIAELSRDHGIILSTHILPEIISNCQRVLIINKGRLVANTKLAELNRGQRQLKVRFQNQPNRADLLGITGISSANLADQVWTIETLGNPNPAPAICAAATHNHWGLMELTPQNQSLEQLFVAATCGEISEPATTDERVAS